MVPPVPTTRATWPSVSASRTEKTITRCDNNKIKWRKEVYTKQKAKEYAETIIGKTVSPYLQGRADIDGFWFLCEKALFAALFLSFASEGTPETQFISRAKEILQAALKNPETLDEMFREEKADEAARNMCINYLYGSGKNAKRIISSCFSRADALCNPEQRPGELSPIGRN